MAVTVDAVRGLAGLDLELVAGGQGRDRAVRWVHVSEMVDPTPWLRGGELLLTTGLQITDPAGFDTYIDRLAGAGIAGLGFGVGPAHETVPTELLRAADHHGLPVLRVPLDTAYVAISEAVSQLLSAQRQEAIERAFAVQQALTAAALAGGTTAVVAELATALDGWAVLVDSALQARAARPAAAIGHIDALLPEMIRMRERTQQASTVIRQHEATIIHALRARRQPRGFILVGVHGSPGEFTHMVLSGAVALLSLELERARTTSDQVRRLRADALAQMLRGDMSDAVAAQRLSEWQIDPNAVRACVLRQGQGNGVQLHAQANERLAELDLPGAALLQRGRNPHVVIVTDHTERSVEHLAELTSLPAHVVLGVGGLVTGGGVAQSYREALHAADLGLTERRRVTRFEQLEVLHLLLRAQSPERVAGFVHRVLGPLEQHDGGRDGPLHQSLRSFLARNGHWQESAAELGIHRHTLRSRIDRIEEITGRDLTSAYTRMEFWFALMAATGAADEMADG